MSSNPTPIILMVTLCSLYHDIEYIIMVKEQGQIDNCLFY